MKNKHGLLLGKIWDNQKKTFHKLSYMDELRFYRLCAILGKHSDLNERYENVVLICSFMESLGFIIFKKIKTGFKKLHFEYHEYTEHDKTEQIRLNKIWDRKNVIFWSFVRLSLNEENFNLLNNACECEAWEYIEK